MTSSPFAFIVQEDNARSSYAMKASADRLATAVTFDDEDTSDQPSVIVRFSLGGVSHRDRRPAASATDRSVQLPNPWSDDEITNVKFGVP